MSILSSNHRGFISKSSCLLACLFGIIFFSAISGADAGFSAAEGPVNGLRTESLLTSKVCANHDCYHELAVDSSQPIAPVLRLALLSEETGIIGAWLPQQEQPLFDGVGNLNEGEFIPSQGDEDSYWQSIYRLAQAGTGPALAVPQVIRAPSRAVQSQHGEGHILATLQVRNIQVRAKWEVENEGNNFTINALAGGQGVLRVGDNITLEAGESYTVTVIVIDEFSYLNGAYEDLTAMAELTIVAVAGAEADGLSFADDEPVVNVTVGVESDGVIYTAKAREDDNATLTYSQIGTHSSFTVDVSDAAAGALVSMIDELSEESTVTLTIEVSSGEGDEEERATLTLEVRAYEELSASLAAGFVGQTYVGETGVLGTVNGSGGSGAYDYLWTLPTVGFVDTDGVLSVNDQAVLGVYTVTAIVSDEKLSSWIAATVEATVSVGAKFELSEDVVERLSVLADGGEMLLTLSFAGGERPYTYDLVGSPSALTVSLSGDDGVLSQVAGESLPAGDNEVVIVVSDDYEATEPGTPDIRVTVILSAVAALSDKNAGSRATVIVNESEVNFYSFEALGGYGDKTYDYAPTLGFSVSDSGTLSYDGSGTVGEVVLTVSVDDESSLTPEVELLLTVGISAALTAEWSEKVQGFVGQTDRLPEVGLSGVGGIPPYTYSLVSGENISLNAESGDLYITEAFASVTVVSVVWSMEDSDKERTPAVSGTVVLDISGDLSFKGISSPVVNVTVGEQAGHVIYTAEANMDGATYAQIGGHSSFTVDVSDPSAGALVSMINPLSEAMTVTLTIEASSGEAGEEEKARLTLEVRAYDELSASLAAGFVGQIYEGESGNLGMIKASGGSGAYVYEWTLPVGFVDMDGVLEADGQATVGVYTITAIAADDELPSWVAATVEATVSVGAALSLLEIQERLALVQGEVGEELVQVRVSGGDGSYEVIGQDLPSGLAISLLSEGTWAVKRAGNLSVGVNVGTVIIDDSYSTTDPGTPALTAVLTIVGIANFVIASPQTLTATMGVSGVLASLSAEGGTEAKTYGLSTVLVGFSLSPAGVLSVSMDVDAGSHTLTVVVSDGTKGVEQTAMATLLVEVLERLRLLSVPSLTVTTSETQDVVHSFVVDGGVGENIYFLENTVTGFGFEFDGGNLKWLGNAEAGLYTLSVLVKDGSPQPQESRVLVTVLVIENLVLNAEVLSPVWSSFDGAVATLTASGGLGGELTFGLVGDSQVFMLTAGSSTLSLNAGLRGHQGAATLSVTVSVSDGNDSAEGVITVLVSGALQVVLADGLVAPVHAQFGGLVGSVVVLGGYAGSVSLTLSGADAGKFELSGGGTLSLQVNASEEQTLTVTVLASRGDETAMQEVVVSVYAPLGLSVMSAVTVTTHKGDVQAIVEGSGGDASSYSYTLTSPTLAGVSINANNGELLLSLTVAASHTLTVQLSDGAGSETVSREISVLVIDPLSDISEAVLAVTLIENVDDSAAYTFTLSGGIAPYSYTFAEAQSLSVSVNADSGVLSYAGGATPGIYTVTVRADDAAAASAPITLLLTVEVSAVLSAVLSDGAKDGVYSFVSLTAVVSEVELSGVGGIAPYTFSLLANDNFGIDADGKNFRIITAFTEAVTVSAVWVLEDSDERTPAVTGTVQVEIRDELGFVNNSPVVNVTVGVKADGVIYTAKAQKDEEATYSQIGTHSSFTVSVSDSGEGALVIMISTLSVAMTATLTIKAVDGAAATLILEVRAYDELSASLAAGFVGQTYAGETGALGAVKVSGGSGDYGYALLSMVPGFEVSQGILSANGQATVGVHTLTVIVSDDELADEGWVMVTVEATVSVGEAFELSEEVVERLSVLVQGGAEVTLLTLSGKGGERPYEYDLVTLTSALTISLSGDEGVLSRVAGEDLPAGDNTVVIVVSDNYEGTEPGTPDIRVTVILSAVAALLDKNPGSRATVIVNESKEVYSFEALGGYGDKTYTYAPTLGFSVVSDSGLLNYDGVSGKVGEVVLTVTVDDESSLTSAEELLLTVGVSAALAVELSDGARQGVVGYVNVAEVLSGVELSGVGGIPPYTFSLLVNNNFAIDEDGGNFRIITAFTDAELASAVWVLEDSYSGTPAVSGTVQVEIRNNLGFTEVSPMVAVLADKKEDEAIYTVQVAGADNVEYKQIGAHTLFTVDVSDGSAGAVVSMIGSLSAGMVATLTIEAVRGEGEGAVRGTLTLEVRAFDELSVELSEGAMDGVHSYVKWTGVLSAVELSGVGGIPPYTFTLLANDNFGIDEDGKNFRITAEFASAAVVSVVWVLEDSNPGTPAVSGTVEVEIRDDGFEYIVRSSAMVRDIVGEILISGGDADGTYSTGEMPAFDPNIGGVTVDVQAEGNSAVVWLENAQIRVSAKYIPQGGTNPATGEWIFFSAREIAELVSLNAGPEFKGDAIGFVDTTGMQLKEAFSTPGMVAIIIGSGGNFGDIVSQVRYVGCSLFEVFNVGVYNCRIQQPTLGFSATLSAALSDGASDVHSFVNLTGVLPAVELSGVGGIPPYTFTLLANNNFGIDEDGKNFRITAEFTDAVTVSVVWVLEDSNPGTPAVSGTVEVEVLERLQLLSVPPLTVTTGKTLDAVYSFAVDGGVGEKIYSLENVGDGFRFKIDGENLNWLGGAEAGLYTLSVLVEDESPQPQESRVLVTVLVIEGLALNVAVLSPVWSTFDGAVATLTASGGNGDKLEFALVGTSQVFTLADGSSTLSLNAGLRGHQGAATLSVTVSVSDGNDSAEAVITVLVSGALQVVLEDLISPVHAQYEGLVGSVVVLGGYAGKVSLTLSGADKDKFKLSDGGALSLQVDASEEQMLTVTVDASRGDEKAAQEVVVVVYAPLGLSVMSAVMVTTHKGDVLAIIEGSGGDASSYSYTLTSPTLAGVSINADNGELLLSLTVAASYTLTVELSDGAGSLPVSREISVLVIEPLRDISEAVLAVTLIEDVSDSAAYTFTLSGGIAPYSYTFAEAQSLSVSVNADSGVLSYSAGDAKPGVYTVTVSADDVAAASAPITLLLTVEVSAVLTVELSEGAKDGVGSFVNFAGPVAGVELSGVGGIAPYTFSLLANDNFAIDADGKNFRIITAFTEAVTASVAWVLDDSDERTPAVTGTVRVEIEDALGFADNKPMVNVTVEVEADGVLYTAKAERDEGATYKQIGRHSSFTVDVSDPAVGAVVSMTMALSEESTVTLTIEVSRDAEVALLTLEVRAYDELSASLAAGFVGQIYLGESGALGTVDVSGGSGAYVYEWTLPTVGFTRTGGVLKADGQATVGVYTVTVVASDNTLGGWIAATVEATVSVGAALSLLEIEERAALVQGEVGEELVQVQVSGGDGEYKLSGQDLSSGLTVSLLSEGTWVVKRAGNLSVGANVGTVIIDDSYSTTKPGTPALTAVLTIVGIANFVPWVIQDMEIIEGGSVKLSAEGGTEAKTYGLSPKLGGFSLSPAGVLSVSVGANADSYTLTVVVSDDTTGAEQSATATLLVEVLGRLQLLSVLSLTVTTSETQDVVYSFDAKGGMDDKIYSLENTVAGFGFEINGGNLRWLGNAEAGLYTLSVLVADETQESRVLVTVRVIENLVLAVGEVLSPVWSLFDGAVATLTASGGNGDDLMFGVVGDSEVFTIDKGVLSLNAGLRGHQGAATLSATVSVSDGNDSAEAVITVLVSGALQVVLADGLIAQVHAQYAGLVGSVVVVGGYAGEVRLDLSGANADKFGLSDGSLSLSVNVIEEQTLTVTVVASRGDETAMQEVVVAVYAPLGLLATSEVVVTTHQRYTLTVVEGSGGDASSYSYTLTSPTLAGVSINANNGELVLSLTVAALHTLTVQLSDGAGSLPESQAIVLMIKQRPAAIGAALRDEDAVLTVTLIENVGDAAAYTFAITGGVAPYSYTFAKADGLSVNVTSGVLSYSAGGAKPRVYVVTVSADDAAAVTAPITLLLTVEVSAVLSVELSDGAKDGVGSFVNLTGVLSAVELSGVGGIAPYTFSLLANDNFAIDADGKNFRITAEFTKVVTVSAVWVLDDSDERTPAVMGTVQVEIRDALAFANNKPMVNVTVGVKADGVIYTAKAQQDDGATYSQIGSHSSFVVDLSDPEAGAVVSMKAMLSAESTVTLTIKVSRGTEESALLTLEVRAYKELSASLAAGFVGQIYVGESGNLGTVDVSGGSKDYGYSWILPAVGFTDTGGVLEANGQATVGVYTVTVVVSDNTLGGWIAATARATVSVGAALSLLDEIQERAALVKGEVGEGLLALLASGGDGTYTISDDLPSGLTITTVADDFWRVTRAGVLSEGANVGTVIINDSYSTTEPGTPALTVTVTIVGIANFESPWVIQDMEIIAGGNVELSAEGGTENKTYGLLPPVLVGFSLSEAGVLSVADGTDADSYTLTVVVSDKTTGAEQTAMATLLVEVLERLQLLSVPSLTVTTSETQEVVYLFAAEGEVGNKTYSLENVGAEFGFEFEGATLVLRDDAEAGLYTLSVLAQDGTQESRVSVTVLVIEDVVLAVGALMSPVWSTFNGAVATLTASGGNGDKLMFALVGTSQVFTLADGSSTLSLNAGLRGHQGAATLSATVSVSDGNDSAEAVITVLVSGALQVALAEGLTAPVDSQYEGLVGSVVVLGGYAGEVSLTLKGPDAGKFELSADSLLNVQVKANSEQTLTVTLAAERGVEMSEREVLVTVTVEMLRVAHSQTASVVYGESSRAFYQLEASGGAGGRNYTIVASGAEVPLRDGFSSALYESQCGRFSLSGQWKYDGVFFG